MAKKSKRPSWFKMFLHQKALIDSVPDETVGKAMKAVFHYFDTGDVVKLDPLAFAVFAVIKPYIDESYADFERDAENGRKGGRPRKPPVTPENPQKPPVTHGNQGQPNQTEAEAEADTEADTEADAVKEPTAAAATDRKLEVIHGKLGKGVLILSDAQMEELLDLMGEDVFNHYADKVSSYIISTGAKPKSHYETMLKWWREDSDKGGTA